MPSETVLSALDNYIAALSASTQHTHQAEDRDRYKGHLARAAILFHLLHSDDIAGAKKWVLDEKRSYGNDFLTGKEGEGAEAAFWTFAGFIDGL